MPDDLTRAQLSDALGLSVAAIRKYERLYGAHLISAGGQKGIAKARTYPPEDVVLFALVAQLRSSGMSLDEIGKALPDRLATARAQIGEGDARPVDYLPEVAKGETVAIETWVSLVRQLESVEGALTAVEGERDYLRDRVRELEDRLIDAAARAAAAEAERDLLAGRPPGIWTRLFGRGKTE